MHAQNLPGVSPSPDRSQRFIEPADAPYLANLAALWTADAELAGAIEALCDDQGYATEPSKSGPHTIALPAGNDANRAARIYLHSRYRPLEEAAKFVESITTEDRIAFYVFGFGLGYHVEALFDRAGDEANLFLFENDLKLLRRAFELRDFSRLIRSGRLMFFWQPDKADLYIRLTPHSASISMGAATLAHEPSMRVSQGFLQQMRSWVGEFESFSRTNINTLVLNGRHTAENIARNLHWYVATPSLSRLRDCYKGAPAVIVSAGPSLRKNKHLLKEVAGRACIIAVQTTLQPLLEMGIEPQFVTSLDYHQISTRFWEKLPENLHTELVAEPKASSAIFDLNPGSLSLLGNDFAENLLAEMKVGKAKLPSGATVAHLAYYLAEYLGCDPIIFIGQDLGFSDGLCYAPGTSYEDVWRPELSRFCSIETKQWEQIVRDRPILRQVPDYEGRPTYTEERLFTYLQQFERDFLRSSRRIIDATEGGVLKRGATSMSFADAIRDFCTAPLAASPPPHPGLEWARVEECISSLGNRCGEARRIEQISDETLPLLQEIRDHLEDQPRVNRAIGRLDALRTRMRALDNCYGLIMQLTQLTELQRFHADRKIGSAKLDGAERQRRQVNRDIDNVRAVISASVEFRRLMEEVITRFETIARGAVRRVAA